MIMTDVDISGSQVRAIKGHFTEFFSTFLSLNLVEDVVLKPKINK